MVVSDTKLAILIRIITINETGTILVNPEPNIINLSGISRGGPVQSRAACINNILITVVNLRSALLFEFSIFHDTEGRSKNCAVTRG